MVLTQKRLALALLLVLALSSAALAEETVVSNTTYASGGTLDLENGEYTVYVGAGNVTTMQLVGAVTNESYLLPEGDCKRLGTERLCYEKKDNNRVRLVIYDLAAQVDLTLDLSETGTLTVGDHLTATIWMNNTGENAAENVRMRLPLPENLTVAETDRCSYNTTHVYWTGTISHDNGKRCSADLRVDGQLDATLQATMDYTSLGTAYEEESDDYAIEAENPFAFTINVSRTQGLEPGQPFVLSFLVTHDEEDVNLSLHPLELLFDDGLEFLLTDISYPSVRNDRVYKGKTVPNGTNFTGKFKLMPKYVNDTGTFKMGFTYNTTEDGDLRTFYREYTYSTVSLPLIISTEPEDLSLEAFRKGSINVIVTNPYRYLELKGYDADVSFTLGDQRIRQRVPYQQSRVVVEVPYSVPDLATDRRETLTVSIIAKTANGDTLEATQRFDVTLTPLRAVTIEKVINPLSGANPVTTVDVYATNNHQEQVTVDFQERIPDGLFARGTTEVTKDLEPGARVLIYSYDLLATGDLPAEANTTTTYAYTYLGNYVEREEAVAITASTYTPPPPEPEEDETNQTATETTPPPLPVDRQQPSLKHVIIAASVLFLFVIVVVVWEWLRHIHTFRIKHNALLKQYQALIDEGARLRSRKQQLSEEQQLMSKKLDIVERHLEGYDKHLPEKMEDLEKRKRDVKMMEAVIKERHDHLKQRLDTLKQKEEALIRYEHNFDELVRRIENREHNLKQDDDLLHQDIKSLTDDQAAITKQMDDNLKQQQLMQDRIKHFKAKHAANLSSKINILASRKKRIMDHHKELEREEARIKDEFEKMQHDLEISKDDLDRAEKLYKQATVQLTQGEHEEAQAAREENSPD